MFNDNNKWSNQCRISATMSNMVATWTCHNIQRFYKWNNELSWVGTFVVVTELAVQSQQCRMTVQNTHMQLQPALVWCWNTWVLSWHLNDKSISLGFQRPAGSWFQVLGPYTTKRRWPVDVWVQGTRRAQRLQNKTDEKHEKLWHLCVPPITTVDKMSFSALTLLVGRQEEHPACKNWVTRCWCGYLSGLRCRLFVHGPTDATVIPKPHHLSPHLNPDWFYPSATGLPR